MFLPFETSVRWNARLVQTASLSRQLTWRTVQKPKSKRRNNRKKPADVRRPSSHQQNPVTPTKLPKQIRSQTERNAVHRKCKTRPSTILILFSNFTFTLRWRWGRLCAVVAAAAAQRTVRRMAKVKCNGKYYMYIYNIHFNGALRELGFGYARRIGWLVKQTQIVYKYKRVYERAQ